MNVLREYGVILLDNKKLLLLHRVDSDPPGTTPRPNGVLCFFSG
jgi:hypothetical protein